MLGLNPPELIVILVIVLLVFGVGRLSRIGGEMGSAIREFRRGLKGEEDSKEGAPTGDAAGPEDEAP